MKAIRKKIGFVVLVVCLFMLQTGNMTAQPDTNSYWGMLSNAEVTAQIARSNADAKAEYRRLYPTKEDLEWASNVVPNWKPPQPWPDPSKRQGIFKHCKEVMRSAVDTNQLELVCSNMATNLPAIREFQNQSTKDGPIIITFVTNEIVISHFRAFSRLAMSNLDEFANLLSSPDLNSYVGAGYEAQISTPENWILFNFWPDNLTRSIEKRTADGQHLIMEASFYEDGKLGGFRVTSPPESIAFDENEKLISYNGRDNDMAIELRPDETGNVKVYGFIFKK